MTLTNMEKEYDFGVGEGISFTGDDLATATASRERGYRAVETELDSSSTNIPGDLKNGGVFDTIIGTVTQTLKITSLGYSKALLTSSLGFSTIGSSSALRRDNTSFAPYGHVHANYTKKGNKTYIKVKGIPKLSAKPFSVKDEVQDGDVSPSEKEYEATVMENPEGYTDFEFLYDESDASDPYKTIFNKIYTEGVFPTIEDFEAITG